MCIFLFTNLMRLCSILVPVVIFIEFVYFFIFQALIDKIHPCLRRDCNYANLDRIRAHCSWDEEQQRWLMPRMNIEKTKLPAPGMEWLP